MEMWCLDDGGLVGESEHVSVSRVNAVRPRTRDVYRADRLEKVVFLSFDGGLSCFNPCLLACSILAPLVNARARRLKWASW
jgi:hypothetical protein